MLGVNFTGVDFLGVNFPRAHEFKASVKLIYLGNTYLKRRCKMFFDLKIIFRLKNHSIAVMIANRLNDRKIAFMRLFTFFILLFDLQR